VVVGPLRRSAARLRLSVLRAATGARSSRSATASSALFHFGASAPHALGRSARPRSLSHASMFTSVCVCRCVGSAHSDRTPRLKAPSSWPSRLGSLDSNPSVPCARLLWRFVSPPLPPLAHSVSSSVMPGDHATLALSGAQLSASPVPACPRLLLRLETLVAPALTRLLCSAALS
jgi:hypothetical protein